ncbi:asparagine synthase-domain-containing protein [Globomyces pollinis-pini]|nr:asparagine synthase-domain-containing protein [Globomyces pollinis-pini]
MCGIIFSSKKVEPELIEVNSRRGPDSHQFVSIGNGYLHGFVLNLRNETQIQPYVVNNHAIAFNGEIYTLNDTENDTTYIGNKLSLVNTNDEIIQTISEINGEWAMIYYRADSNYLYFGRDFLGRRSLMWHLPTSEDDCFQLSSVSDGSHSVDGYWEEVPTEGIYRVDLDKPFPNDIELFKWNEGVASCLDVTLNSIVLDENDMNPVVDCDQFPLQETQLKQDSITSLKETLSEAVRCRVTSIPEIEGNPRLGILFSGGLDCMVLAALAHSHLPVSEPIDLLNVSFENPRSLKSKSKSPNVQFDPYSVPDRLTGKLGAEELQTLYPSRRWNFVEINVPYEDAMAKRQHIVDLMKPLSTVMDLSIAIAFWFASRGIGHISRDEETVPYKSSAKVLLSGLGADEQLGGYSRHRSAYEKRGWQGLVDELSLDVSRISTRNLGRDDRIISDHGKEVRFPFLDQAVIQLLSSLPVHIKTDPRYIRALGDKMLLRQVALTLGLERAAIEPKRAVQFGARTAKMELGRQKGHEAL